MPPEKEMVTVQIKGGLILLVAAISYVQACFDARPQVRPQLQANRMRTNGREHDENR